MALRFFLIEDDAVVRKMLEKIIHENELGEVVGQADDGLDVSADQLFSVDVVLIDLLMPGRDGIQTIKKLREEGFAGQFIMISQVENKEMIGQAYLHGVDTYIQKPINRYEVVSVLKRVAEHISVLQSLQSIRQMLEVLDKPKTSPLSLNGQTNLERQAQQLLLLLGIAGEAGSADLLLIMRWLAEKEAQGQTIHELPPLKELYMELIQQAHHAAEITKEVRALEQRIRRLVLQAFTHLASLGLTDYTNPTFEYFAPRLFDFAEIRKRMKELENGDKASKCRINVRKFLTAFYMEVKKAQLS
ncbi:DNA-binding domain-containing protein [Parageobacillus sp. VR-IP]|uniref:response regulator n=1 Tax=Parageobacillus sp. VR-IP TaxID=2742205 RepID=UPI00158298E1|nr:response regulator [Parageobacillus sp. VR-IP]NUK30147.1 DNA-binding domain-containing protein [Parageobacillus sp. VR-IP]